MTRPLRAPDGAQPWADGRLTPRQLVVAELVADGESRRSIAVALGCAPGTVRAHLAHIALRLDGPGTVRVRICRYIRGRRDAALARAQQTTPSPWETTPCPTSLAPR